MEGNLSLGSGFITNNVERFAQLFGAQLNNAREKGVYIVTPLTCFDYLPLPDDGL